MLMTGESDYRTPSGEAEQFYEALKLRRVDTALVRVPHAPHDISSRPSLLIAKVAYVSAGSRRTMRARRTMRRRPIRYGPSGRRESCAALRSGSALPS